MGRQSVKSLNKSKIILVGCIHVIIPSAHMSSYALEL